ncbi:hypothetical protein T492DRAFT_885880, partial [Pavlovales sp. CCMP2436]
FWVLALSTLETQLAVDLPNRGEWMPYDRCIAFSSMVQTTHPRRRHGIDDLMQAASDFVDAHPRNSSLQCWLSPSDSLVRFNELPNHQNRTGGHYTGVCGKEPGELKDYILGSLLVLLAVAVTLQTCASTAESALANGRMAAADRAHAPKWT